MLYHEPSSHSLIQYTEQQKKLYCTIISVQQDKPRTVALFHRNTRNVVPAAPAFPMDVDIPEVLRNQGKRIKIYADVKEGDTFLAQLNK